jgi:hypothetical protein
MGVQAAVYGVDVQQLVVGVTPAGVGLVGSVEVGDV